MKQTDRDAIARLYVEGLDRSQEYDWENPYKDDMSKVYRDDRKAQQESPSLISQREKHAPTLEDTPNFYNTLLQNMLSEFNEWDYESNPSESPMPKMTMQDLKVWVNEVFAYGLVDTNVPYDFENELIDENDTDYIQFVDQLVEFIRDNW